MADDKKQDIDLGITRFEYGDAESPQRAVLTLSTGKHYNGGLASRASVYWVGEHSRQQLIGLGRDGDGDFNRGLTRSERSVKATQKNIDLQHVQTFSPHSIAALVEQAKAHYAKFLAAGIDGFKNTYPAEVQAGERK